MRENSDSWRLVDNVLKKILIFIVFGGIVAVLLQSVFGLVFSGWSINDLWEGLKFLPKGWVWIFNGAFIVSGWFKVFLWVVEKTGIGK